MTADRPSGRKSRLQAQPWNRMSFELQRILLRGAGYRLVFAALLVTLISLVAGSLISLLEPELSNPAEAVWWAFLRLTDSGYLGDDEGAVRRTVSTLVTVLGSVIFMGLLVAILTQWLSQAIAKLELGETPISVSNHLLILGWTDRTASIVHELLSTRDRAERFLERRGAKKLRIVILAEHLDPSISRELKERLGSLWNDRSVMLRSGSPLRLDHLERVRFLDALVIVLPGADHTSLGLDALDAQSIKTLLSISLCGKEAGAEKLPHAVVAISDSRRALLASRTYGGLAQVLSTDHQISRLIAQEVRHPGVFTILHELAALGHGNSIFVRHLPELAGRSFRELSFPRAIAIGLVRHGAWHAELDPGPNRRIDAEDRVVFLARSFSDCDPAEAGELPKTEIPPSDPRPLVATPQRILILGWSEKLPVVLQELERFGLRGFEAVSVSLTPAAKRDAILARYLGPAACEGVRHVEADYTLPGELEKLEPGSYDEIILLASDRFGRGADADARTILGSLLLHELLPEESQAPRILVEIMDPANAPLFSSGRAEVLVSTAIVSHTISQVTLRSELGAVYESLLGPEGASLAFYAAREYLGGREAAHFVDMQLAALARNETALGLRRAGSDGPPGGGLDLNPDREKQWTLGPGDELVVLASSGERRASR